MIDLSRAKFGDKLKTRDGRKAVYLGRRADRIQMKLIHSIAVCIGGGDYEIVHALNDGVVNSFTSYNIVGFIINEL